MPPPYTEPVDQHIRAKLILEEISSGDTWSVPVESCSARYALNQIPQATISLPFGLAMQSLPSPLTENYPDNQKGYLVRLRLKYRSSTYNKTLFRGYVVNVEHAEGRTDRGGGAVLRLRTQGYLGLLEQQPAEVLEWRDPETWNGDPWYGDARGMEYQGRTSSLAGGTTSATGALMTYLAQTCIEQSAVDSGSPFSYQGNAADRAKWVLDNYYSYDYPYHHSHDIYQGLDSTTREHIASGILRVITSNAGTLWTIIQQFCAFFHFSVVPTPGVFYVVPLLLPHYVRGSERDSVNLSTNDIIRVRAESSQSVLAPVKSTVMMDEVNQGVWNMNIGGGAFTNSYYSGSDNKKPGRMDTLPWPGWFPTWTSDGRGTGGLLCSQHIADEMWGGSVFQVDVPYLFNYSPGTILELQNLGDNLPTYFTDDLVGVVRSVHVTVGPGSITSQVTLSHVMEEETYDDVSFDRHPVTGPHTMSLAEPIYRYFIRENLFDSDLTDP